MFKFQGKPQPTNQMVDLSHNQNCLSFLSAWDEQFRAFSFYSLTSSCKLKMRTDFTFALFLFVIYFTFKFDIYQTKLCFLGNYLKALYKTELAKEFYDYRFNYDFLMEVIFFLLTCFKVNPIVVYIEYQKIHSILQQFNLTDIMTLLCRTAPK